MDILRTIADIGLYAKPSSSNCHISRQISSWQEILGFQQPITELVFLRRRKVLIEKGLH